jgi:hypothetical protein
MRLILLGKVRKERDEHVEVALDACVSAAAVPPALSSITSGRQACVLQQDKNYS